ncbi:MAG: thiamine diphosphokinase [Clostridia bacterium]|nr:thiamine diphosphokinase [Clostridia bacterium]
MGVCYIVGAGDCTELSINKNKDDLIIAADGGYRYLINANISPDLIIGDFDSLGDIPDGENVIRLNPVKDITDMDAAMQIGIEKGYSEFHIYGACGGRIDHTLANIQLVASAASKDMKAFIHDGKTVITALCNESIKFTNDYKGYISVFSHSDECTGVTLKGLKYPLENAVLSNKFPLGVSNEFIGCESEISIANGILILVYNAT